MYLIVASHMCRVVSCLTFVRIWFVVCLTFVPRVEEAQRKHTCYSGHPLSISCKKLAYRNLAMLPIYPKILVLVVDYLRVIMYMEPISLGDDFVGHAHCI